MPTPAPVYPLSPSRPAHTWSAPIASPVTAIVPHGHVAREVRDGGVLGERLQTAGGDVEHGALREPALRRQAVARGERFDLVAAARDDDRDGRRDRCGEVLLEVGGEPRAGAAPGRRTPRWRRG